MRSALVPIISLLMSTFFMMVGAGLASIVLPVRGAMEGWPIYMIGLLGTGYALAFTAGCLIAPRIVRRAGHVRAFASLAALLAIAALLHGLIVHPVFWILVRGVSGFALAGAFMVIESWLNERVTNETRGLVFSIYMIASLGAMMTGQFIMPLTNPALTIPFMLCAIMFAAAVIPTAMSRQQHPKPLTEVRLDLPDLFRTSPAAAVGVILGGVMEGSWNNMAPVFGKEIGFSTTQIATLLVVTMAGAIVFQYPLGRLSDRIDRRLVMSGAGALCCGIAAVAELLSPTDASTIFVLAFLFGGLVYPVYSIAVAHANDHVDSASFVKISGGLLILYGIGTMFGPLLAAGLMGWFGPHGIFLVFGAGSALMAIFSLFRTVHAAPAPEETQDEFATMPLTPTQRSAPLVLDPRAGNTDDDSAEQAAQQTDDEQGPSGQAGPAG
ncbi:MFS transporter [Pseudochelatococcus contaminans]|uniref:MFS family permease n=1 Tax=Pseudochelatococcus contaminans TaxID=1538103 RepID=A0A7W5Z4S3_9HYPH|nr:MFS transporter [Pseudochelatococcus contaminans]MBB3809709.1 MFS family permease [Pseudochelatococcus contaminans]